MTILQNENVYPISNIKAAMIIKSINKYTLTLMRLTCQIHRDSGYRFYSIHDSKLCERSNAIY